MAPDRKLFPCPHCQKCKRWGSQLLPGMNVYVCFDCVEDGKAKPFSEEEIDNKTFAPWEPQQIESLRAYQQSTAFFPFVCKYNHDHILTAQKNALVCDQCGDKRTWAYEWMLDFSWRELL